MKREVRAAIERKRAGQDDRHTDKGILGRIEWRSRSRELARLFDSVCEAEDRVDGDAVIVARTPSQMSRPRA